MKSHWWAMLLRSPRLGPGPLVGLVVILSFCALWLSVPTSSRLSLGTLSLGSGIAAVALMATAALLAARWPWVESFLGGLDRVYAAHKWLGIWALVLACVHFAFKSGHPDWQVLSIVELPSAATRLLRQLSFLALMLIVLLALNRNIPYRVWRWWHKLSGPLFLVVVAHWLSFRSPIVLASPAGVWLAVVSALGVLAAGYKLLLYPFLARHAEYRLVEVSSNGSAVYLQLVPVTRAIPFAAGQFAFVSFKHEGLREPHPYTIASAAGADGSIAFMVRSLGDYTARLVQQAQPGLLAEVYAPFGRFQRQADGRQEIWIAGGVGITPFIAWLQDCPEPPSTPVTLFHFTTPGRELPAGIDLAGLCARRGVNLVEVTSGPATPAFREQFAQLVAQAGADRVQINFCGPPGLLEQVRGLMRASGVGEHCLRHELFQFR